MVIGLRRCGTEVDEVSADAATATATAQLEELAAVAQPEPTASARPMPPRRGYGATARVWLTPTRRASKASAEPAR